MVQLSKQEAGDKHTARLVSEEIRLGNVLKSVVHRKEQHFARSAEKLFTLLSLVGHALIA